jgi:hypothetical protein
MLASISQHLNLHKVAAVNEKKRSKYFRFESSFHVRLSHNREQIKVKQESGSTCRMPVDPEFYVNSFTGQPNPATAPVGALGSCSRDKDAAGKSSFYFLLCCISNNAVSTSSTNCQLIKE